MQKVENQIVLYKLEQAEKQLPWQLISSPTIDDLRVSPRRKQSAMLSFLLSSLAASMICIIWDRRKGIIYEFAEMNSKLDIKYIDSLYKSNLELSSKILNNYLQKSARESEEISIINATSDLKNISKEKDKFFKNINNKYKIYSFEKSLKFEEFKKIIFFIEVGTLNNNDILFINKLPKITENKILGWFCFDSKTNL